jgi:hypothetical protein
MAIKINLNTPRVKLPELNAPFLYWDNKEKNKLGIGHYNLEKFEEVKLSVCIKYTNPDTTLPDELQLETYNNMLSIDITNIPKENSEIIIKLKGVFSKITKQTTRSVYTNNLEDILNILCSDNLHCSDSLVCKQ